MKSDSQRWRRYVVSGAVVAALTAALTQVLRQDRERLPDQDPGTPTGRTAPPSDGGGFAGTARLHLSRLRNSAPARNIQVPTKFTGSARCAECHESIAADFAQTAMGRAMTRMDDADLPAPPPDAVVDDGSSPRRYRILHRDGVMWHQELLAITPQDAPPAQGTSDLILSEHPVAWQIGSGHHSRSYLIDIDGFLIESPVTWYTSRQAWGMSPGYDRADHPGFGRVAEAGCLYCHAGDARPMDGTSHRLTIHEGAISCERCHGPGQLHADLHDRRQGSGTETTAAGASAPSASVSTTPGNSVARPAPAVSRDDTIVNPRHLDRELSDSVCSQCHLRSAATILAPGLRLDDFRPGMRLADLRTDYRFVPPTTDIVGSSDSIAEAGSSMTVVGHFEQLQLSRCYQQSELSCVTCHDPHVAVTPDDRVRHYQAACRQCHPADDCDVDDSIRMVRSPDNDCTVCHMPGSGTDIPHLTFTHHRIGLHADQPAEIPRRERNDPGRLVPVSESRLIPPVVRQAMLGLAYLEFSGRNEGQRHARHYQDRAYQLLVQAWRQGEHSPEVASALVALAAQYDLPDLAEYLKTAADQPGLTAAMRVNFLLAQAFDRADRQRFQEATTLMQSVVEIRRSPSDWSLLADFARAAGQREMAIDALERAVQQSPLNTGARRLLVEIYRAAHQPDRAARHQQILSRLESASAAPDASLNR